MLLTPELATGNHPTFDPRGSQKLGIGVVDGRTRPSIVSSYVLPGHGDRGSRTNGSSSPAPGRTGGTSQAGISTTARRATSTSKPPDRRRTDTGRGCEAPGRRPQRHRGPVTQRADEEAALLAQGHRVQGAAPEHVPVPAGHRVLWPANPAAAAASRPLHGCQGRGHPPLGGQPAPSSRRSACTGARLLHFGSTVQLLEVAEKRRDNGRPLRTLDFYPRFHEGPNDNARVGSFGVSWNDVGVDTAKAIFSWLLYRILRRPTSSASTWSRAARRQGVAGEAPPPGLVDPPRAGSVLHAARRRPRRWQG